ncbi:HAD-like domain-containing protein [Nemania sp. FL0031]|nr:HAD-like domain-containing protein [Nemania sp. FL0031]
MDKNEFMAPFTDALKDVKALTFDVFGTVVDWRSTVHAELIRRARNKVASSAFKELPETLRSSFQGISDTDWGTFAQAWRASYGEFTRTFVPGETEWKDIDTHHHDSLKELLQKWHVSGVYTDEEIRSLSRVWHYLRPWDDSALGIQMLGTQYVTATLSNGNRSLLEDLNAHGSLGFKRIISTADFGAYKPHPSTYLGAVNALECRPNENAMVAAHLGDLRAARTNGLRTIYVERDREEEWLRDDDLWKDARQWVDLWISQDEEGFVELARRLGIS